jgi:hypothetical protein
VHRLHRRFHHAPASLPFALLLLNKGAITRDLGYLEAEIERS